MSNPSLLTPAQFRQAAAIKEQIEALTVQLAAVLDRSETSAIAFAPEASPAKKRKKYKLSAAGKAKRMAAQKARWERFNAAKTKKSIVR